MALTIASMSYLGFEPRTSRSPGRRRWEVVYAKIEAVPFFRAVKDCGTRRGVMIEATLQSAVIIGRVFQAFPGLLAPLVLRSAGHRRRNKGEKIIKIKKEGWHEFCLLSRIITAPLIQPGHGMLGFGHAVSYSRCEKPRCTCGGEEARTSGLAQQAIIRHDFRPIARQLFSIRPSLCRRVGFSCRVSQTVVSSALGSTESPTANVENPPNDALLSLLRHHRGTDRLIGFMHGPACVRHHISDGLAVYKLLQNISARIGERATDYTEADILARHSGCARSYLSLRRPHSTPGKFIDQHLIWRLSPEAQLSCCHLPSRCISSRGRSFQPRSLGPTADSQLRVPRFRCQRQIKLQPTREVKRGEQVRSSAEMKWRGKREVTEKTRRPATSSGTIPTCEKFGSEPAGERNLFALLGGEQANRSSHRGPIIGI
ncbi:hypothetical protein PR048_032645 [Dryococelus australis]|uniref:Uncharacterized protein n=1 Tax=Dryococelus australis TaxID=614101 RepID=A0ABQ9G2S7_9NEOP|nr:hypothetical protein PR048_032645 [Dryococelus australis]